MGESTIDLSTEIVCGRIPGGVAVLCFMHKKFDQLFNVVRLDVDCAIVLSSVVVGKKIIILNIYTPYESSQNEENILTGWLVSCWLFRIMLPHVFFIVGDMNADVSDDSPLFANHLMQFCSDNGWILSSKVY